MHQICYIIHGPGGMSPGTTLKTIASMVHCVMCFNLYILTVKKYRNLQISM